MAPAVDLTGFWIRSAHLKGELTHRVFTGLGEYVTKVLAPNTKNLEMWSAMRAH